ncbi:hypothetical protein COCNU_07G015210 [Cocos nucifera]|uniref:Uncharacterized protein n=1 Tax=Cocos nucifera TaxID=13894 RepID=A0A8K0IH54_COCNU|nr:hypothetical protein COCNU_07G015210 [Cocos nucifera]
MSLESALKLLGVSESASFDDILRAKNAILASCKDDQEAVAQVEAAYDMLLMQSLSRRRAGKVVNSSIRYADVKPVRSAGTGAMPKWLEKTVKNVSVSVESPSTGNFGVQAGVYGALMVFTIVSGTSTSSAGTYIGADVPGIILATSFGASLYFLTKKSISLGKATIITVGGLVVGAVVGSAVEKWLQVDVVPFFGIHSPAVIVEAAYDMLLMQSLSRRRAGKVVNSSIRYADVKPVRSAGTGAMPKWLEKTVKNVSVSVESPSTGNFGVQAGVYGALMVFTIVSGTSTSSAGTYIGADVPGIILATSFGASLYFLTKKSISLGKATIITVGGLVVGAVVGSAVEKWLQVDVVPFFGIHSPAVIVSEFILFSQFLVSLYLR